MIDPTHEKLFRNAFHFASIGMALVGLDGRWLRVNRSLCELVGYSEPELMALTFQDLTHPADLGLDLAYVAALLRGEIQSYQMEKRYRHKDGHTIWALLHVSLVRDEAERPEVFISQIENISARKRAEQGLEHSLHENQRLLAELQERSKQVEELRGHFLKVCAWTKRIYYDGRWISLEHFLSEYLHLHLTHGISKEALDQVLSGMEEERAFSEKSREGG